MSKSLCSLRFRWLFLSLVIAVVDQLTKYAVLLHFTPYQVHRIFPGLSLALAFNRGAGFSLLASLGIWGNGIFLALSSVVCVALGTWMLRASDLSHRMLCALSLVLGGALGNWVDRVWHGQVTDFILLSTKQWQFPVFNVADMAICMGAMLWLITQGVEDKDLISANKPVS